MTKIDLVFEKLPILDFLKANMILERFDVANQKVLDYCKKILVDIKPIKEYWKEHPRMNFGEVLIEKGYVHVDPILKDINEVRWMYNNGDISYEEYKQFSKN